MREILLTSSVLILALLILRRAFREKISRRVQYALWALVLVRLLTPVSLPPLDISVLTMAEPVRETISARLEAPEVPAAGLTSSASGGEEPAVSGAKPVESQAGLPAKGTDAASAKEWTLTEILGAVWLAGAAGMALWLVWSNLAFAARLRRYRMGMEVPGCKYPVYMMESRLDSPCLFGILRPAVYLTPAAIRSEESLRHVLAHEETHARHLDPLWSLLRSVCLVVYWFDPLVWIAVSASRTDCELACDEGVVRTLGEEERLAYGRTLLSLIPVRRLPVNPLLSVTPLSSDKKRLRDRIARIAENRKTRKLALCAMSLLTAAVCVFTFAGCAEQAGRAAAAPPSAPNAAPAGSVSGEEGPLLTIPLEDLDTAMPFQLNNTVYSNDCEEVLTGPYRSAEAGGRRIACYRAQDGYCYFAEVVEDQEGVWRAKRIGFADGGDAFRIESFEDVLGWEGIIKHYNPSDDTDDAFRSYYGVDENGDWYGLIHVPGYGVDCRSIDLDGDGVTELLCTGGTQETKIIFRRDGKIYSENVAERLKEAMPERSGSEFLFAGFDPDTRCLIMEESLPSQAENGGSHETAAWDIYFDGESLLVCERSSDAAAPPNSATSAQEVQAVLDEIMAGDKMVLELARPSASGRSVQSRRITVSTSVGNARNRQRYFTDPGTFSWTRVNDGPPAGDPAPDAEELTVSSLDGSLSLTFFSGSEQAVCRTGGAQQLYRAKNMSDPSAENYDWLDIFNFMRLLFDEAELNVSRKFVVADKGQSREEAARKWAEVYEGALMETVETNRYHCTFVDVRDVKIDEERSQELLPEYPGAADVFLFDYSVVFVPSGDPYWFIAGNTGEYAGNDVPEGAYQYWRCGYLYLLEDGWHCDGVGTGP